MTPFIKKRPPALKHGGYSTMGVLPGESAADFAKLHRQLVAEWTPSGALEDETVVTMARALWRKRNLPTLRLAKFSQQWTAQIYSAMVPAIGEDTRPAVESHVERTFDEKCQAAEQQARQELGELYELVEMGEAATMEALMQDLQVQERLDAVVDRCIKRLLMVRGLKSMSIGQAAAPMQALPSPVTRRAMKDCEDDINS